MKRGGGAHLEVVLVEVLDFGRLNELVEAGHEGLHLLGHARHEAPLDHQTARASTHDANVYVSTAQPQRRAQHRQQSSALDVLALVLVRDADVASVRLEVALDELPERLLVHREAQLEVARVVVQNPLERPVVLGILRAQ